MRAITLHNLKVVVLYCTFYGLAQFFICIKFVNWKPVAFQRTINFLIKNIIFSGWFVPQSLSINFRNHSGWHCGRTPKPTRLNCIEIEYLLFYLTSKTFEWNFNSFSIWCKYVTQFEIWHGLGDCWSRDDYKIKSVWCGYISTTNNILVFTESRIPTIRNRNLCH